MKSSVTMGSKSPRRLSCGLQNGKHFSPDLEVTGQFQLHAIKGISPQADLGSLKLVEANK